MGRVPQEPASDTAQELDKNSSMAVTQAGDGEGEPSQSQRSISAVTLPNALDFIKLKESCGAGQEYDATCRQHMMDMVQAGLRLTDAGLTPMEHVSCKTDSNITIQVEKAPVDGVPYPDLDCVRHIAEFDVDAKTVFDVYVRLNYTDAIDAYTYLVEMLEEINCGKERFSWAHVAYTADKIMPFFAHRDFVTFDFVDTENLMLVSRSCSHPDRPQTKTPEFYHCFTGIFSKDPSRTIRSPPCYFMRVIPLGENKCRVVQFQYSDLGGVIPPGEQTKAVVRFGLDNLHRFNRLVQQTQIKVLGVGPHTTDYLSNPLVPKWRQPVDEMIPGL